jgi:hypothetical protein
MSTLPTQGSKSREAEWISIQTTITQIQDQQNLPQSRIARAGNAAGNAAFYAGNQALAAKDVTEAGVGLVKKVLGDSANPILNHMIQLADKLVDVGKVVPIVAPAFVILKVMLSSRERCPFGSHW